MSCSRSTPGGPRPLRAAALAATILLAVGCSSSCCWWTNGEWHATTLPQAEPRRAHETLRLVIDGPMVKALLDELTRRRPVFRGPLPVPPVTRKLGSGCRAPDFGDCDPCKEYSLLSRCSMIRQGSKPCERQARTDAAKLLWANQRCPADQADCGVLASGLGLSIRTEQATYEVALTGADVRLGDGRLRAHVDLGGLKARATTLVKLLDRCGQPTQLPLVKIPERCEGVELGVNHPTPIRLDAGFVIESRGQELRGRLDGDVGLKLPPGGAYVKQDCYKGTFLGYDFAELAQRETVGALEREWTRREAEAQRALQAWLGDRLARPLVDAIPPSFRVAAGGGEVTFAPHLEKIAVTPAAITVQADLQVLVPFAVVNQQLAALGRVRVSKPGDDPLWFSDLKAEPGPGGTLKLRAAYSYEWARGSIKGGGKGHLAFAGRGALEGGNLRLGEVFLLEVKPTDSGCFDERMRHRVAAALKGDEIRKLEIRLQAQLDAAVEKLRGQRLTRDGFAVEVQPDALSAWPAFEPGGVRLHLAGFLRPRLVPAAAPRPDPRPARPPTAKP